MRSVNKKLGQSKEKADSLLIRIFSTVLRAKHFPAIWKHARVISILKRGKDPALPSSYRPIGLLETIGKLFKTIPSTRILNEVSERELM